MNTSTIIPPEFFPLLSMIFILGLGLFVFLKNKRGVSNKLFFLISILFSVWLFGTYKMFVNSEDEKIIFWDRFIYLGVTLIPAIQYHFSLVFTHFTKKRKKLLVMAYVLSSIFLILSRTEYFVDDVFRYRWGAHTIAQPLHHIFLIFFFFYIFALLYNFVTEYRKSNLKSERYRLVYFTINFAILNLVGGVGYFPAYKVAIFSPISLTAPLIFSVLTAYAIIRYRLMDIKLVLRQSFVYLAPLITILLSVTGVKYIFIRFLTYVPSWFDVIILILVVLSFIPLKNYYYRIANKYFFSSLYDSQQVIAELSDKLRSTLELKKIYEFISETLTGSFHSKAVGILMFDEKRKEYRVTYNSGFKIGMHSHFASDKHLHNLFTKKGRSIVMEELKNSDLKQSKPTIDLLLKFGAELLTPLNIKDKTIGLIVLGAKESGDMYNNEDLGVLEVIGAQAAIALQNAFLYEESLKFGQKLEKEVEKATQELREANIHLKELDKAKTEFISITSHQLRTPLTGIKGYLSMLLEGDFGRLKEEQAKVMEDIFNNTQRLVRLINIFLNVSRIESGRLKLEKTKFNLVSLIEEVVREIKIEADKKKLKLEFVTPKREIEILADRDKLTDVILNLIDNAIKYTPEGGVIVDVEIKQNKVRVSVKDTGVGINKEETEELFTKFTRGRRIPEIETTGAGLGLFIAKKIIELHQGKIWVESEGVGKGSEFIFEIPFNAN